MSKISNVRRVYKRGHELSAFKKGDKVVITRKAESYENGWPTFWAPSMNIFVGNEVTIAGNVKLGYNIKEASSVFPYFVLKAVCPKKEKLND